MVDYDSFYDFFRSIFGIFYEVAFFWQLRFYNWWNQKPVTETLKDALAEANHFEEWDAAAYALDELQQNDLWRQNPTSKFYDYRLIYSRLQAIVDARESGDILALVNLLRSGLVRNLGHITAPRLFNRAYAGTKLLIEDYITQVALAIDYVTNHPTTEEGGGGLTDQAKLDLLHDTRQAFGRTALVLQGGAIFGLCHIGVLRALHLRGLLPRIIVGTATGALIAALVAVHPEREILGFLTSEGIDLTAFAARTRKASWEKQEELENLGWIATLTRRTKRLLKDGYFLDVAMLEECVRTNVGDLTFEEAYAKTKRVLNITIVTDRESGLPSLLNYLTAPNVLIWSAAVASNTSFGRLYSPVTVLCKDSTGQIKPWTSAAASGRTGSSPARASLADTPTSDDRDSPLARITELFNVNHFIVSQARPYMAPFFQTGDVLSHAVPRHNTTRRSGRFWLPVLRVCMLEIQHRLRQLDALGLLASSIRPFMIDETVPGASMTLVPQLSVRDFMRLLERPTKKSVTEWIVRGERSVWPAIGALKVRCTVEVELDRGYQLVRRRKPMDAVLGQEAERPQDREKGIWDRGDLQHGLKGSGEKRKRAGRMMSLSASASQAQMYRMNGHSGLAGLDE